jgi:hypothetical protein
MESAPKRVETRSSTISFLVRTDRSSTSRGAGIATIPARAERASSSIRRAISLSLISAEKLSS